MLDTDISGAGQLEELGLLGVLDDVGNGDFTARMPIDCNGQRMCQRPRRDRHRVEFISCLLAQLCVVGSR